MILIFRLISFCHSEIKYQGDKDSSECFLTIFYRLSPRFVFTHHPFRLSYISIKWVQKLTNLNPISMKTSRTLSHRNEGIWAQKLFNLNPKFMKTSRTLQLRNKGICAKKQPESLIEISEVFELNWNKFWYYVDGFRDRLWRFVLSVVLNFKRYSLCLSELIYHKDKILQDSFWRFLLANFEFCVNSQPGFRFLIYK